MPVSSRLVVRRLECVFSTHWTPKLDLQLMQLFRKGRDADQVAQALFRSPEEVILRWHELRKIPGVVASLQEYVELSNVYLRYRPQPSQLAGGGL